MSTHDEIAQRFANCKRWVWVSGMHFDFKSDSEAMMADGGIVLCGNAAGAEVFDEDGMEGHFDTAQMVPRLSSQATIGCIRLLVRRAFKDPEIFTMRDPYGHWVVIFNDVDGRHFSGPTEAEALLAALEAAP